jgi:hypothetical protein
MLGQILSSLTLTNRKSKKKEWSGSQVERLRIPRNRALSHEILTKDYKTAGTHVNLLPDM